MPLADSGANAEKVADAAVTEWAGLTAALAPVIGQGGVAALLRRTVHLAGEQRPWLLVANEQVGASGLVSLRQALIEQGPAEAALAHDAMAGLLVDMLTKLIGLSLTHRLLAPVWPSPSAGEAVQDAPS